MLLQPRRNHRYRLAALSVTLLLLAFGRLSATDTPDARLVRSLSPAGEVDQLRLLLGSTRDLDPASVLFALTTPASGGVDQHVRELLAYEYLQPLESASEAAPTALIEQILSRWDSIASGHLRARLIRIVAAYTASSEQNESLGEPVLARMLLRSALSLRETLRAEPDGPAINDVARLAGDQVIEFLAVCEASSVMSSAPLGELISEIGMRSRNRLVVATARSTAHAILTSSR